MHELVTKFVPTSVFPHKILGLLEAKVLTLDCKVSHLYIIDSGWVSYSRNIFAPAECSVAGLETSILRWRPSFYSIFIAQPLLSQAKLQIL